MGFSLKRVLATVLPANESTSEPDSDKELTGTGDSQAASVQYVPLHPKAIETSQTSKKCCPSLTKPSTNLPTLTTTRALHPPFDDAQAAWLNDFLMNTDIPSNVHLKHQQCGVGQDAPKVYLCLWGCPTTVYNVGVFAQGHDMALTHTHCHYPELGVWCPWVGQDGCEK